MSILHLQSMSPGNVRSTQRLLSHGLAYVQGGVVYSNKVTTVSPIYAADLLTREHGYGLDLTLNDHQ